MFRDLRLRHLAVAQLTLSRHSSSKFVSALDLRQFRLAVRWADDFALDSLVTLTSSNLAALRFLVKLSLLGDKRMVDITGTKQNHCKFKFKIPVCDGKSKITSLRVGESEIST